MEIIGKAGKSLQARIIEHKCSTKVEEISCPEWQDTSGMRTVIYTGIGQNHPQRRKQELAFIRPTELPVANKA
jgi:hypothetical protein